MEVPMLNAAQRNKILAILQEATDLTIATNRDDGYPQATTVSFVSDGLTLYFGTWSQSQKAKNIAADNRVSVAITDPYKSWTDIRGISLAGRAHKLTDPAELARVSALMLERFPQITQFSQNMSPVDLAMFRIDAEVISILDYAQQFGHTELVAP
jgi:general stress protein 26